MITSFQTSLNGATWIDVNTQYTLNNLPDRFPDSLAITHSSLFNLFNCPIGSRARTFQPTYGSMWHHFLQEPIDETTAVQMKLAMIQSIARWEPRIKLDTANTRILPNLNIPGYEVTISGFDTLSKQPINIRFTEQV